MNNTRLWKFGSPILNLVVTWNLSKKLEGGKAGDWAHTSTLAPISLVPVNDGWLYNVVRSDIIENGEYYLALTVESDGKMVGSYLKIITLE